MIKTNTFFGPALWPLSPLRRRTNRINLVFIWRKNSSTALQSFDGGGGGEEEKKIA